MSTKVMLIKLPSGEEIIGECFQTEAGTVMKNPCMIHVVSVGNNKATKVNLKFSPYAQFCADATILLNDYSWVGTPLAEIEEQYKRAFSPIILPETTIVTQ